MSKNTELSYKQQLKEYEKQEKRRVRRKWHWGTFGHVLTVIFTLAISLIALVVMVLGQAFLGPSQSASDMVTQLLHQSSALKFVPYLYLFENTTAALNRGEVTVNDTVTDTSLITVRARDPKVYEDENAGEQWDKNGLQLIEIKGATYHGYMMIVQDPSRVSIATCGSAFTSSVGGKYVDEMVAENGGIAGMNAGAFSDGGGAGNGGMPEGIVYSNGKFRHGSSGGYTVIAGFDKENILHVGKLTKDECDKIGIRDACAFGPVLISNGVPSVSNDKGLNPRTAIGQRADGAVLMLVIDGRQSNSMGASISDLISIMTEYGAVNACNMDGGSSTIMYMYGTKINDGMTISVSRHMPTAWIVK